MSTTNQSALKLLQYNKDLYKTKEPIDSKANKAFGTWSYANMYDALYERFSQNQNFNMDMWHQAIQLGEQDQYLAMLEQNKNNQLSAQFYDPQYYDYETMMLELYASMADNTTKTPRTEEVFDALSGEWVQQDIGEMTEQEFLRYQLNKNYEYKAAEIERQLEQERKDQMSWWQLFGNDVLATLSEFGEGLLSGLTGIVDFFVGIGYATGYSGAALIAGDKENANWLDNFVNYFGDVGLTQAEKETIRVALDDYERRKTHFRDIDGNITGWGTYIAGISNSIGMMIPAIVANYVTGGAYSIGTIAFYTSIFSNNMYENATNPYRADSPSGVKIANAALKTGAEVLIEYALGKVLGGTIQNQMLGIGGRNISTEFITGFSKAGGAKYLLKSAAQEGLEEFLQDFGTECIDQFMALQYEGYGKTGVTFQTLIDSFLAGFLSSLVMSGGAVAKNTTMSAIQNKIEPGSGDILIETDKGPQKVTGLNRLAYSSILSDFNKAVEDLKKGKMSSTKNLELAQEVYGALTAISQYYSSFDKERIKNCEMLLDRVVKAENASFAKEHERAASILSEKTVNEIEKTAIETSRKTFAESVESTFRSMVGEVHIRHAKKIKEAAEKVQKILDEGGVTETKEFIDADGNEYKDAELKELAERLGGNATNIVDELRKAYDWIIVTDGYASAETEGHIFVPEGWLQNYTISDIYKYLEQTRVLEHIISAKQFQPMLNKLVTFNKDFTGQEKVSKERALMDFLFNKSVYQAFLLSNAGKNAHEYKNFIFQLHDTIKGLAEQSKYYQQLFKGKQAQVRINMLNKIYEQIKETMREPTIKAIINWGFDPQVIGADSVLTPKDKILLNQYAKHKRVLANANKTGKDASAYENLKVQIIRNGKFNDEELAAIKESEKPDATDNDKLLARILLDEADVRMTTYDFATSINVSRITQELKDLEAAAQNDVDLMFVDGAKFDRQYLMLKAIDKSRQLILSSTVAVNTDWLIDAIATYEDNLEPYTFDFSLTEKITEVISHLEALISAYKKSIKNNSKINMFTEALHRGKILEVTNNLDILNIYEEDYVKYGIWNIGDIEEARIKFATSKSLEDITHYGNLLIELLKQNLYFEMADIATLQQRTASLLAYIEKDLRFTEKSKPTGISNAFVIPSQALALNKFDNHADAQFVADKMLEFGQYYGISARQMMFGDLTDMSFAQRDLLTNDMQILGVDKDNYVKFVQLKLEQMLGGDYIVTPLTISASEMSTTQKEASIGETIDATLLEEELYKERNEVRKLIERMRVAAYRSKFDDSEALNNWVLKFYDTARSIFSDQASKFGRYHGLLSDKFVRDFLKNEDTTSNRATIDYIVSQAENIDEQYNRMLINISEDIDRFETDATYIHDFAVTKKIPAKEFISADLMAESIALRDRAFMNVFKKPHSDEQAEKLRANRAILRKHVNAALKNDRLLNIIAKEIDADRAAAERYLRGLLEDDKIIEKLVEGYYRDNVIIDPYDIQYHNDVLYYLDNEIDTTSQLFGEETHYTLSQGLGVFFHNLVRDCYNILPDDTRLITDFIDTSRFSPEIRAELENVIVVMDVLHERGYYSDETREIHININTEDYIDTLAHEFNHALQDILKLPNGGSPNVVRDMPDLLNYILKHYQLGFRYAARREGISLSKDIFDVRQVPAAALNTLAVYAYRIIQGEIFARTHMHNEIVHGFMEIKYPDGKYLLAPDGKTKFKLPDYEQEYSISLSEKTLTTSPALAGSALDASIQRLFELKAEQEAYGYTNSSYTYHSYLTKYNSHTLMAGILNPSIDAIRRTFVKLTDAIKNPQQYLAPEILVKCNGDFSEGNVYYRLREYVEEKFAGVSIDRKESFTDSYVWVDDNSFDDLLVPSIANKVDDDDATIVTKYELGEKIPLNKFYKAKELARLGVHPNAFVIISPTVNTETRFDRQHQIGAIYINANKTTSDYVLTDKLNHEFRHLLQYYNGFETGFTPDFEVTKEMLADVKAHAPGVFKNDMIVKWAKARYGKNWETGIVQHVVYLSVGGEMNAYAWNTDGLAMKPTFVTQEAGNPTIFMPWYDAKTGEGRHKTKFIAYRADDMGTSKKALKKKGKEGIDLPMVDKAKKKDARSRYFNNKKAENNNLKYYKLAGIDQLDPRMQDFVIATTGYEDKIPKALWNSIRKGKLKMQNFYTWFQKAKDIDDFTFNLINKHIFKNDYITSMEELNEILSIDPAIYWAAAQVLRKRGLPLESLVAENDVDKFMEFMSSLEGTKWYDEILDMTEKFTLFQTDVNEKGEPIYENLAADDNVIGQMRTIAMHFFNGTLAGAFYVGNTFKQTIYWNEMETRSKIDSADKSLGDGMSDDKDVSLIDAISNEDGALDENSRAVGNDIIALYELDSNDASMYIDRLVAAAYSQKADELIEKLDLPEKSKTMLRQRLSDPDKLRKNYAALSKKENLTESEKKQLKNFKFELAKYREIMESLTEFKEKLETLVPAEVIVRGTALVMAQMNNARIDEKIFDLDTEYLKPFSPAAQQDANRQEISNAIQDELGQEDKKLSTDRDRIQRRIKQAGETLAKYLNTGVITFEELPADVQELIDVSITARKTIVYKLKDDAHKVGRGRKALPGKNDYGRKYYVNKHDITKGNEAYRHDVSGILEVDKLLRATNESIRKLRAEKKRVEQTAKKKTESLERQNTTLEQKNRQLKEKVKTLEEDAKNVRTTEIRVVKTKKSKTSDTPNVFNIISAVDMPYQLRKIFDVSFTEMADTKVQFVSRDKDGRLYNKEDFSDKEFISANKHEVKNWDAFYEANRDTLLSLTRNDVLDIVEFLKGGMRTIDGPSGKLAAFEIFVLGYILDAARRNTFDWNFSVKEVEIIERLYEQRGSEYGSGLNAVKQMLKVVDPLKKVRQRMLDDWDVVSDTDKDDLIKAVDDLQKEKDPKKQKDMAQKIIETLHEFEKRQIESDKTKYPRWSKAWWGRQWSKAKSWRYMAMLSGPPTWIRNILSNVTMGHFNKTSDMLAAMVFKTLGKGEYRKEQWDLNKTKISTDAKNFIDTYILNNPIFDPTKKDIKNGAVSLYDLSGKYDPRQNKKIQENRELLINLIVNAYENKYAQDRRFDSKAMKTVAAFVDKRISDKWFVRRVASRYFGKMLTIEAQRGNVDLSQGLSTQALDLFAEAVLMANQEYMHKRSAAADMLDNLRDKHPVLHEALSFWQPFINSSVNWFAETLKYTPLGLANSIKNMCRLEKQITRLDERRANGELVLDSRTAQFLARRDIGKGVLGMILSGLGIWLAMSGRLRIEEDDDKFYAYIDEQIKLDISSLFASSSLLVGASIAQKWIEQSDGEVATWEEVFTMLTDTTLEGFFAIDILERHKWGSAWDSVLVETESVMRSFVPQAWQTIIACTNHYDIKYSRGFKGMWERWLNTWVPTQPAGNKKINPYTGELEDKYSLPILGGLLQKGILGPKVYWVEVSEVERMCRELGVNKNELTGDLTVNEQKYKLDTIALNTKYGELNKESLAKIKSQRHKVEMPDGSYQTLPWDKMSDKQRANVLSRTMTHNADIAKIYMWTQMGHKYYASDSMWAELRKLGITQNVYKGDKGFVE